MTLESTISKVNLAGFRVFNLFQLESGLWQANLYNGDKAWEFAQADSPEVALTNALFNATNGSKGVALIDSLAAASNDLLDSL